jgi:preprotein translocase subunit SecF
MNPSRVDFMVDMAYGLLLLVAIVLIATGSTGIGIAFGLGALVSYAVHVAWKMARFDPDWMTKEVTENIEESLTEEVSESVGEKVTEEVTEEVTENVGEKVTQEVTESVEEKVTEEVSESVGEKVTQEVTESVEEKVAEEVTQEVTENVEQTLSAEIETIVDQLEAVNERIDRRPRKEELDAEEVEAAADGDSKSNADDERDDE